MKKLLIMICTVSILFSLNACGDEADGITSEIKDKIGQNIDGENIELSGESEKSPSEKLSEPFPGKIAFITMTNAGDYVHFDSAEQVVYKYGKDKIEHVTWPNSFMSEQEQIKEIVMELGEDSEVKAIIVNQAVPGSIDAFEPLNQKREDIFIVFLVPNEGYPASAEIADICIKVDELSMGPAMVEQAYKMGAETFVHYSFQYHMSQTVLSARRNLIKEKCDKLGIRYIDTTTISPFSDSGISGAQQFILDDVPVMVEKYGKNTAFFATYGLMQFSLIEAVVETGAIYPQPNYPSPEFGFPSSLNLTDGIWLYDSVAGHAPLITAITEALSEKDMLGRMSSWPEDPVYTMTNAAVEYTIRYLNGEAPREVDAEILRQIIVDNVGVEAYLTPYVDDYPYTENGNGKAYNNFLLLRMDYITFE